eukprot:3341563-Pyramimonas_sp.AAC.1
MPPMTQASICESAFAIHLVVLRTKHHHATQRPHSLVRQSRCTAVARSSQATLHLHQFMRNVQYGIKRHTWLDRIWRPLPSSRCMHLSERRDLLPRNANEARPAHTSLC